MSLNLFSIQDLNLPLAPGSGGTGTSTVFTTGSVIFVDGSGVYAQNNAQFFWDNVNFFHGIGTNTPAAPLHIVQPNALVEMRLDFFSNTNPFSMFRGNGTPSAITQALTGDILGGYAGFGANNSTGFNTGPSGRIRILSSENQANNSRGGDIVFDTVQTGQLSINEKMRVLNNGNLGIGITAPTSLLHTVSSAAQTTAYTGVLHSVTDTSSTASVNKVGLDIESTGTWNGTSAVNTALIVNATGGTTNYAATFSGGNVGIGTTAPASSLAIIGATGDSTTSSITVFPGGSALSCFKVRNDRHVGINTDTPGYELDVNNRTGTVTFNLQAGTVSGAGQARLFLASTTGQNAFMQFGDGGGSSTWNMGVLGSSGAYQVTNNATAKLGLTVAGTSATGALVGIGPGASTPGAILDVGYTTTISNNSLNIIFRSQGYTQTTTAGGTFNNAYFNQFLQSTVTSSTSQTLATPATIYIQGGPIGAGSVTATNSCALYIAADNAYFGGKVGINQTAPAQQLDVVGSIQVKSNILMKGSSSGTMTVAPAAAVTDYTITWPAAQGAAGTTISNNGSGVLSWVSFSDSNTAQSTPSNPTGTTDLTGKMMGLAGAITPTSTGKVLIIISGTSSNNTILDGSSMQIRTGTGSAPANGDALTGTAQGGKVRSNTAVGGELMPFSVNAIVSSLTLNTAIWIDIGLAAITGGTASIADVSISVHEL